MNPRRAVPEESAGVIMREAASEHALAILSLRTEDDWATFKSRFLECDPKQSFFVLDYQAVDGHELPELAPGQCVGVSFRHRNRKVLFATVVEARGHFLLEDKTTVPAIRYRWPERLTELQRRAYYRTPVPESMSLPASLWPGGLAARAAAQGSTLEMLNGTLVNVSCGGALLQVNDAPSSWKENETLGLEAQLGDGKPPIMVDARFRGVRHDEVGHLCVAVQFIGLEMTVDGRLILQRLASTVQRLHRASLSAGVRDWNGPRR
jgi:c-di-GMP-binding flagellar brake protein YcgR